MTPLVESQVAGQAKTRGISEDAVLEEVFLEHSAVPSLRKSAVVVRVRRCLSVSCILVMLIGHSSTSSGRSCTRSWIFQC
ncbi:hypothetical protein [Brevibacterium jeotgali]